MLLGSPTPSSYYLILSVSRFSKMYMYGIDRGQPCGFTSAAIFPRVPHARSASFPSGARAATRIFLGYIDTVRIGILYTAYGVEHTAHRRSPSQSPRGAQVRRKYNSIEMYGLLSSFLSTPRRGSRNTPGEPDIHAHVTCACRMCMSRCGDGRWRDTQAHISLSNSIARLKATLHTRHGPSQAPRAAHMRQLYVGVFCARCAQTVRYKKIE